MIYDDCCKMSKNNKLFLFLDKNIKIGSVFLYENIYYVFVGCIGLNNEPVLVNLEFSHKPDTNMLLSGFKTKRLVSGSYGILKKINIIENNKEFNRLIVLNDAYKQCRLNFYDICKRERLKTKLREGTLLVDNDYQYLILVANKEKYVLTKFLKTLTKKEIRNELKGGKIDSLYKLDSRNLLIGYEYYGFMDIQKELIKYKLLGVL